MIRWEPGSCVVAFTTRVGGVSTGAFESLNLGALTDDDPLNVVENLRHVRNEIRPDTGREVDWELNDDTTFEGAPDKEHSNSEQLMLHAKLPAADANGKATKIKHKLHLTLKNEW